MTVKNRVDVERRVEQHYENNGNKGKPFDGTPRKEAEKYAMKQCGINETQAITVVKNIAKTTRGEIIMPENTSRGTRINKKGDNVKELVKAANKRNAPLMKAWQQNDRKAHPENHNKRRREYYQDNPDYAEKSKRRQMEKRTELIYVAQAQYPERLHKALLINAPYGFQTAWKMIRPLLDEKTASKIQFLSNDKLVNDISPDVLCVDYGGTHAEYPLPSKHLRDELALSQHREEPVNDE
jgi:hypothetical protein